MNNYQKKMLKLLDASIHNKKPDPITDEKWKYISKELMDQTVYTLPLNCLDSFQITDEKKMQYIANSIRSINKFQEILTEQDVLFQLLDNAGIRSVILKGTAAAMYYPVPKHRMMGDIDIIVNPTDFEMAYLILKENGYLTEEVPESFRRHIGFTNNSGIHIELHYKFSSSNNEEQNTILDKYIYDGITQSETVDLYTHKIKVLPPLSNGLVLLSHINQHLGSGLGLRQIIDWMCFVECYLTDSFWDNTFARVADSIKIKTLAQVVTLMCKRHLGLCNKVNWCDCADADLADELMEYILVHGNFGRKDSPKSKTVSVIRVLKNPIKGFVFLQTTGTRTWAILKKHPYLKPFAWAYQCFRLISHGRKNDVTISKGLDYFKSESNETAFLEKLGVTRL